MKAFCLGVDGQGRGQGCAATRIRPPVAPWLSVSGMPRSYKSRLQVFLVLCPKNVANLCPTPCKPCGHFCSPLTLCTSLAGVSPFSPPSPSPTSSAGGYHLMHSAAETYAKRQFTESNGGVGEWVTTAEVLQKGMQGCKVYRWRGGTWGCPPGFRSIE